MCAVGSDRFLWSLTVVGVATAEEEGEEDKDVPVEDATWVSLEVDEAAFTVLV